MGFYGNITNTANTTFSFDIIYSTRESLDANCDTDGVFLGRYVLVDYDDQEVIKAYFIKDEDTGKGQFYNKPNPNLEGDKADKPLEPRLGVIYQALNITADTGDLMFYKWNQTAKQYQVITEADKANTPYVSNFRADVEKYGRGYDSTVWVKHYDPAKNKYQYVMVAELNAAVPTFHLVTDPPTPLPTTPYIDRDTTNLDYYLHQQSNYGLRVGSIKDAEGINIPVERDENNNPINRPKYSDEAIKRKTVTYTVNSSGYQDFNTDSEEDVWLDIFYNNKGFQEDIHTNITELKDEIGYSLSSSGRKYGNLPLPNSAITADDTLDWHIRLPGIGNAICRMWDRFYGNRADNKRYLNFAQKREDTESNLVTYDQDTVIGIINTAKDMLGYYFLPISALDKAKDENKEAITKTDILGSKAVSYTVPATLKYNKGDITESEIDYPILKCLYYSSATETEPIKYYHYAYTPTYKKYEQEKLQDGVTYYYETAKGTYRVANPEARKYNDADNNEQTLQFWEKIDGWTLQAIIPNTAFENSIYGLITEIHRLLGTNVGETRDYGSIQGSINIIKDIVESLELKPDRLVCTNEKGQLATYNDTYFPSATWDRDEVLNGNGEWVSRFASIKVRTNEDNPNRKIPKVVSFTKTDVATATGPAQLKNLAAELVSDNQKEANGTKVKYLQDHDPNTLILASRNKWIKLHPDATDDSIEFEHIQSPIVNNLYIENINTPNKLDHITPNNTATDDDGNATENSVIDTANFQVNYKMVEDQDTKEFSKKYIGTELLIQPDTDTLTYNKTEADQNDNRLTIPTITVDNAGHVIAAGTKNYNIPHGFKKIHTSIIEDTVEDESSDTSGTSIAKSISDTLELAPQNRWIDIATTVNNTAEGSEVDEITFGHRLVPTLKENVTLNGDRRTKDTEIPNVYRYGLPQNKTIGENGNLDEQNVNEKANTFNVPYIEIDKAGHVVAAETHTVEIPHGYSKISTGEVINDKAGKGKAGYTEPDEAAEVSVLAETLEEEVVYAPFNKWIRINATNTKGKDTVTFGHEIHTIVDTAPPIEDLDSSTPGDKTFTTQVVNWDQAGHIIEYGTKTWTLPNSIRNIKITGISDGKADPVGNSATIEADYTSDTVEMSSANKWIKLTAKNNDVTFGHLVQDISTDTQTTNLNTSSTFNTEEYTYDEAGHITSKVVRTLTLPYNYKKFAVSQSTNETAITTNTDSIVAQNQVDTMTFAAGNKWIQLAASNTDTGEDTITIAHQVIYDEEKTAIGWLGTDPNKEMVPSANTFEIAAFGDTIVCQGYKIDKAGHIIDDPIYAFTLPTGSYVPDDNTAHNGARVITGIGFTPSSGKITSTSKNVGALTLVGYGNKTTKISADSTINEAFAALDNRIDNLTLKINDASLKAIAGTDVFTIVSNDGIVLETSEENNSFTINHKSGAVKSIDSNTLYKFNLDTYGHISEITKATAADVGLENVTNESKTTMFTNPTFTGIPMAPTATEGTNDTQIATTAFVTNAVNKVAWAADYTNFDALYAAVKQKLEEEYTLIPKEKEEEENPTV